MVSISYKDANTKIVGSSKMLQMENLLFLVYYVMEFFFAVYIVHCHINFNPYSFKSPFGGKGHIEKYAESSA